MQDFSSGFEREKNEQDLLAPKAKPKAKTETMHCPFSISVILVTVDSTTVVPFFSL